jgi:hypothetical protein
MHVTMSYLLLHSRPSSFSIIILTSNVAHIPHTMALDSEDVFMPHDNSTADEAIATLDSQIVQLKSQIVALPTDDEAAILESQTIQLKARVIALKQRRDSFMPLCRLPSEILGRILSFTQVSASTWDTDDLRVGLYNFEFDQEWENTTLTCHRIHEISTSTPQLWAYTDLAWPSHQIERYQSRAEALNLQTKWAFEWVLGADDNEHGPEMFNNKALAFANACFQRSRAVYISLPELSASQISMIISVKGYIAPHLSILHVCQCPSDIDQGFLQSLYRYPALTKLSITEGTLHRPISVRYLNLTRLHLRSVWVQDRLLFSFLRNTPRLEELLLDGIDDHDPEWKSDRDANDATPMHNDIALPHLHTMIVQGTPQFTLTLLQTLLFSVSRFQKLMIRATRSSTQYLLEGEGATFSQLFQEVKQSWHTVSGTSLPPADCTWKPNYGETALWLDVHTQPGSIPMLRLETWYIDDHALLYQQCGLDIESVKIDGGSLRRCWPQHQSPWTARLEQLIDRHSHGLRHLTFLECDCGAPEPESWIRTQQSKGFTVHKISFVNCLQDSPIFADYTALKESGLVQQIEWKAETVDVTASTLDVDRDKAVDSTRSASDDSECIAMKECRC